MQRGEAPEAWSPKHVGGPTKGLGAWTVAMETATTARPFAPSHIGENQWSKLRGQDRRKNSNNSKKRERGGKEGVKIHRNNPAKQQLGIGKQR